MAVIRIPKTPVRAFRKDRPISDLLRAQIEHLEWASRPAAKRSPPTMKAVGKRTPKTEGEAAARIEELTRMVLEAATVPPPAVRAAAPAAPPPAPTTKARKATARRRKAARSRRPTRVAKRFTARGRRR